MRLTKSLMENRSSLVGGLGVVSLMIRGYQAEIVPTSVLRAPDAAGGGLFQTLRSRERGLGNEPGEPVSAGTEQAVVQQKQCGGC